MQNLSEISGNISHSIKGDRAFNRSSEKNEITGSLLPVSFQDHLSSAIEPGVRTDASGPAAFKKDEAKEYKSEYKPQEDSVRDERFQDEMKGESLSDKKETDSGKVNDSVKQDDGSREMQGSSSQKNEAKNKTEKKSEESAGSLAEQKNHKKDQLSEGLFNELFKKAFSDKKESVKMQQGKQKDGKETEKDKKTVSENEKFHNIFQMADEMKRRETVNVLLDPEKWKVSGKVDVQEAALQGLSKKKNSSELHEQSRKSFDEKGEGGRDSSSKFNDIKNLFTDSRTANASLSGRKLSESDFAQNNKQMFNELVEKARLNLGSDGNSTASIRLNPENLGKMTLNLRIMDNNLEAKILVGSEAAKKMILDDIEQLKLELRSQGIQVDSFSVKVKESFESGMDFESDPKSFFENSKHDFENFSGGESQDDEKYELFTNQIAGNIDDSEYGTVLYQQNVHEGSVYLSA